MSAPRGAYVVRNGVATIAGTEYAQQFTKSRLVPDTPIQTLKTLVPEGVVQDIDLTAWTWEVNLVQDFTAVTGVGAYFNANSGQQVTVVIAPLKGSTLPQATFTIIALPVDFGNDQGAWNTVDASFPVVGQPVFAAQS
jgi:hypothetical protein